MSQTKAQVNKLLTGVSNGIFPGNYIAESLLPSLLVVQKTGIIGAYGNNHIRIEHDLVAGQSEAKRVTSVSRTVSNLYAVQSHALEGLVTEDDYDNVETPFDAEKDETMGVTSLILSRKEKILADNMFSTSVLTQNTTLSGTDQFSDYAGSSPLQEFKAAQEAILDGCGMMPNAAVISMKVFNALKYHPEILENMGIKYNGGGKVSKAQLAAAMDIEEKNLFIGDAPYNSAVEGQTDSIAQIWGKSIAFFVRPDSSGKYQTSFGYYVRMRSRGPRQVYKSALHNPVGSTSIIVKDDYAFELVNTDAAYLIKDAIA